MDRLRSRCSLSHRSRRPQAREYFGLLEYSLGERLPELIGETEIVDNLPAMCVVEYAVHTSDGLHEPMTLNTARPAGQ